MNYSQAEIARRAVEQHEERLRMKFPNIKTVSDAVHDLNQKESHVIAIYLKDNNTKNIPEKLDVRMPDGTIKTLSTEMVIRVGTATIQFSQPDSEVSNDIDPVYPGSICCAVRSTTDPKFFGVVTSAHIITHGVYDESYNDIQNPPIPTNVLLDGNKAGTWFYKLLSYNQDLAVIKLDDGQELSENYKYFSNQYYTVSGIDVKPQQPNVTIISKNNRIRDAYILDYGKGTDVIYDGVKVYKKNIIFIGSTNDRQNSHPVSQGGDSGSCVFKRGTDQLIGMLLGCDEKFTFVLPIDKTLQSQNLITL